MIKYVFYIIIYKELEVQKIIEDSQEFIAKKNYNN